MTAPSPRSHGTPSQYLQADSRLTLLLSIAISGRSFPSWTRRPLLCMGLLHLHRPQIAILAEWNTCSPPSPLYRKIKHHRRGRRGRVQCAPLCIVHVRGSQAGGERFRLATAIHSVAHGVWKLRHPAHAVGNPRLSPDSPGLRDRDQFPGWSR